MKYFIYLYEGETQKLTEKLLDHTDASVAKALDEAVKSDKLNPSQLIELENVLRTGLSRKWKSTDEPTEYVAFHWLMEAVATKIFVGELYGFKYWEYWLEAGLDEYFEVSTLPAPNSGINCYSVRVIPHQTMPELLTAIKDSASDINTASKALQVEMMGIIESLLEDRLDLIGVFVC